jgi:hypothetical protein
MCFEYDDYPEFTDDRVVAARKSHRCDECRAVISPGERYYYHSGKSCGELAEGCHWNEAWPPLGGLAGHLIDSGMGRTPPGDVPATFQVGDLPGKPAAVGAP